MTRRQPRVLGSAGITAVCVAVALATAAVTAALAVHDGEDALAHPGAFVVITLLLIYTHVRPTRLVHRYGAVETDHLDDALFVPMVLMLGPFETALAVAVACTAGNLAARRAPIKTLFNVGQIVLSCLAGYAVARALGADGDAGVSASVLLACLLGGLVFHLASSTAVAAIVRLSAGHAVSTTLRDHWRTRRVASLGAMFLGLVGGVAVHEHPVMAIPAILLAWTVERAHVAVVVQHQARLAAEWVQDAVVAIRNSGDPEQVRGQVSAAAARALHGRTATFVDPTSPVRHGAIRATIDSETALELSDRIGGGAWLESEQDTLSTLAAVGGEALRNAELVAHLRAITDGQTEGVLASDSAGVITFANPAARRMLDHVDEVVGRMADDVFTLESNGGRVDLTTLAGDHSGIRDDDAVLKAGDKRVPVGFTAAGLPEPQVGAVLVLHDITERKALEDKLTYLAFHDPLTDLPNRRLFEDRLDHALVRAERHHTRHALLMVDLDRFKLVNDSYGHPAGDLLLTEIAALLVRTVRPEDTCTRLGGDEFGILIEDIRSVDEAVAVADRILDGLAEGFTVDGHEVFVSASIGIACSDQAATRESRVAAADAAAYDAKAAGKARHQIYTPDADGGPRARLELEASLRRALEHGELELYYQPLVGAATGETAGAEALVRWNSPEGLIPPVKFIPLAEETGLIVPLGAWVLEEACRQGQAWTATHPELPPLKISVNLSAHQLSRRTIVSEVDEVLRRTGFPAENLCLEITETVVMRDVEAASATLAQLKELGVQVAIDDFGTGYSSLSYLKRFPLDIVKVDRSFTSGLGVNPVDTEIVAAVIRLAAARGITVVAEGVETVDQRFALDQLGCPLIQGFLIAEPLRAADFEAFWTAAAASPHALSSW